MTKTVKKLMLAAAGLFALGIMIPVLALTMAGRNVAGAKGSSVLDGTLVLKDKYADKVRETEQKRNEARDRKNQVEAEINQLQHEADDILAYLKVMDEKQTETALEMEAAKEELDRLTEEYDQATIELAEAEDKLATQYESMKKRVRYIYENGQMDALELYLQSKSISDILNASEYIQKINEYDHNLLQNYALAKADVEERRKILGLQLETMQLANDMYEVDVQYITEIIAAKQDALAQYEEKIGASEELLEEYIVELASAQKDLDQAIAEQQAEIRRQEEIRRKQEEEARRKAMEQAAKQQPAAAYNNAKDVPLSGETSLSKMIWPLPGDYRVGSKFGPRTPPCAGASSFHKGWDIGGKFGAEVVAVLAGTVTGAGMTSGGGGNVVTISHGNGYATHYMHLSTIKVSRGQYVQQGQVIGLVGSTGISTGPHLHFSLSLNGNYIDPAPYLHY
ncbi:MAG: peptidoglycan DD-metalloendopeptidase family protein [Lachnospiraceae bacterium]|nr:peptidoglycan DD-metalloendopeptidase family protein [Lachnospiraceae bacterium]